MPGVRAEYHAPGHQETDDLGDRERRERAAEMDRAFAYYLGQQRRPLKTEDDGTDSNVILNLTGQTLDDLVMFMGVPRLEAPGGVAREPDETGLLTTTRSREQQMLDAWWDANDLPEFMVDTALSGMLSGHSFVRLYMDEDGGVSAALLDPRLATVFWEAGNVRRALWYRLAWKQGDEGRRQDIVPNALLAPGGEAVGWTIIEYSDRGGGKWQEIGRDAWDEGFSPIVEWKNQQAPHQYYGRSDVRRGLNDAVNFVASNTAKIIKHHAGPQTVLTGGRLDASTETGPGTILDDLPAEAKVYNLEMQSDLSSSLAYLDKLETRFFSEMGVVDLATMKDKLGQITNFGVRMLFVRMTNKLTLKRRLYGEGIAEVTRRALALQGTEVEKVSVFWDEMLPVNRLELVQTLEKEKALGVVSIQTATEDLGRDFESEQERIEEEGRNVEDATAAAFERFGRQGFLN